VKRGILAEHFNISLTRVSQIVRKVDRQSATWLKQGPMSHRTQVGAFVYVTMERARKRHEIQSRDVIFPDTSNMTMDEKLVISLLDFPWSTRVERFLRRNHSQIKTVGDLIKASKADMLSQYGFGRKSLREIENVIALNTGILW
jgi:DNA-directed RNA polymerase alpha subunit